MGLRHIRQFSVLHRDMKPGNCLLQHVLGQRMVLKICDFGNSVFLMHVGSKRFPQSKKLTPFMTTYCYSSPEVCTQQPYGFPLDMWSTGIIIWELLQDDTRTPAIDFDYRKEPFESLKPALDKFCKRLAERRETGTSSSIEQFAWQLLEVAAEARPSATQAVDQLASMGLRDASQEVPEGSRDHHGLEVSSTQPDLGHVADGSHAESTVSPDPH